MTWTGRDRPERSDYYHFGDGLNVRPKATRRGSPCRWEPHALKPSRQAEASGRQDVEFTWGLFTGVPRDPPGKTKPICIQRATELWREQSDGARLPGCES